VKFFWPNRSNAKGFSIQNITPRHREKVTSFSFSKKSNQSSDDNISKFKIEDHNQVEKSHISIKRGHWANRDFSEYKATA